MSERVSVNFDRAAEYYDATRGWRGEHDRETTEMLAGELHGRDRVLEVGVGTGQLAIPLHETGVPMAGIDLSAGMLTKLLQKATAWSRSRSYSATRPGCRSPTTRSAAPYCGGCSI